MTTRLDTTYAHKQTNRLKSNLISIWSVTHDHDLFLIFSSNILCLAFRNCNSWIASTLNLSILINLSLQSIHVNIRWRENPIIDHILNYVLQHKTSICVMSCALMNCTKLIYSTIGRNRVRHRLLIKPL